MKPICLRNKTHLLTIIFYVLISCIVTYPLILNLKSGIYGFPSDNIYQMHDTWFAKTKFLSKTGFESPIVLSTVEHSKLITQLILDLIFLTLATPTNPLIAYNILILFSFVSSAFIMYLLSYKITRNEYGAFISGIIFSFSAYHYTHAQNHLEISQIEVIPLFGLSLLYFLRKRTATSAMILGLGLGLITLTVNYYGYFLLILTAFSSIIYFAICKDAKSRVSSIKNVFTLFVTAFLVIGPGSINYITTSKSVRDLETITWKRMGRSTQDFFTYSARPWFYVLPDVKNPITGKLSQNVLRKIVQKEPYFLTSVFFENEHSLYLGIGTLILCFYALIKKGGKHKKIIFFLLVMAIVFAILSAPPYITISMRKIYFPSFFLSKIIPQFRVYARAGIITLAFLSIVSGFGIKYLLEKVEFKQLKFVLTTFIALFILVDMYKASKFTKLLPVPEYYNIIKTADMAEVIEFPKPVDARHLFYQMYHHKTVYGLEDFSKIEGVIEKAEKPVFIVYRKDSGKIYEDLINNEKGLELNQITPLRQAPAIKEELPNINIKNGTIVFKTIDITLYKVE